MGVEETILQAARDWIKATGSASPLTDGQIIDGGVTSPRPPLPYISVTVILFGVQIGEDEFKRTDNAGTPEIAGRGDRRATVSIQAFGETAGEWLERSHQHLDLPTAEAIMDAAAVTFQAISGSSHTPTVIDTGKERRYLREYTVYYSFTTDVESQTEASTVVITQTYDSPSAGDLTDTITLSL